MKEFWIISGLVYMIIAIAGFIALLMTEGKPIETKADKWFDVFGCGLVSMGWLVLLLTYVVDKLHRKYSLRFHN